MVKPHALLVALVAACSTFENEDIVIDTRVLAMSASLPDQVIDIDPANPADPVVLLEQVEPSTICALVADPSFDRRLRYAFTLCVFNRSERCVDGSPHVLLAAGVIDDPDVTVPAPQLCATVMPDGNLLGVLLDALDDDAFGGLGGIDYNVALQVGGEGVDPSLDLFAGKTMRVTPRIPAARTENRNPTVDQFDVVLDDGVPIPLPMGRCVDQVAPVELATTQRVRITPVESADARETYVLPTIDGDSRTFTESLTYQWMAGAGSYSSGSTGGPRDFAGNPAELHSDFRAPKAEDVAGVTDVPLWIVQRDERLGSQWYESCVRVVP